MKKIMILVAALGLLMACGGNSEKQTIEQKAIEYSEKALKAVEDGDFEQLMKLGEEYQEWYDALSEEEQDKVDTAEEKWEEENAERLEALEL